MIWRTNIFFNNFGITAMSLKFGQKVLAGLLMCSMLLLCGCGSDEFTPLSRQATILAFGDSLTVGVGTTSNNSYPTVLAELTSMRVIGSGVSGETTSEGLIRLAGVLEQTNPDFVILLEGGNDILRNVNADSIKSNLKAMISLARGYGAEVLLVGVPEKKLLSSVAPLYQEIAAEDNVVLIDDLIGDLMRKPGYKSDAVHLNKAGYRALAKSVFDAMKRDGAL